SKRDWSSDVCSSDLQSGQSPAAAARRTQIITATIDVIADEGYGRASFSRIAERAGLSSTRLISYHFAGKDELIAATAKDVMASEIGSASCRGRARME